MADTTTTESLKEHYPFVFDPGMSDDLKKHLLTTLTGQNAAARALSLETRKWWWSTPLAIALTGLITVGGNFFFDYLREEAANQRNVELTQLVNELKSASDDSARRHEAAIVKLKADLDGQAAVLTSQREMSSADQQFQYKIVERALSEGTNETERAKSLLFFVRIGVLSSLKEEKLAEIAETTIANAQGTLARELGTTIDTGVPQLTSSAVSSPETELRPLPVASLELLRDFEGFQAKPYNDGSRYCSIGYGHLVSLNPCENVTLPEELSRGISPEDAATLLEADTMRARLAVQRHVTASLTDAQFGSLVSFVFNVGEPNFASSTLLRAVNSGNSDEITAEFARWGRLRGQVVPTLAERRKCEAALFFGAQLLDEHGRFDRTLCSPPEGRPAPPALN